MSKFHEDWLKSMEMRGGDSYEGYSWIHSQHDLPHKDKDIPLKTFHERHGFWCCVCRKSLEEGQEYNLETNNGVTKTMFSGGVIFKGNGPYGSQHDNNEYVVIICDSCLWEIGTVTQIRP